MLQRVYFVGVRNDIKVDVQKFVWPTMVERPSLAEYLIDTNNTITDDNLNCFSYYLKNPTNLGKYMSKRTKAKGYGG